MFHLPIPIEGNSGEPVSIQKRKSHGYEYTIMKYEYGVSEGQTEPYTVVTNAEQTKVFAYMAPRETTTFNDLKMADYQEGDVVEVKESIEGTMITFFWNDETDEWNICTRNGIGGEYSFMRPTNKGDEAPSTFREMVVDTFRIAIPFSTPYGSQSGNTPIPFSTPYGRQSGNTPLMVDRVVRPEDVHDLNDVPILDALSKTHCYTCILQHPANHIVYRGAPFCSFLKLVAIYETGAMPPLVPHDSTVSYRDTVRELANPDYPEVAKSYLDESKEEEDDLIWKVGYNVFCRTRTTSEFIKTFDEFLSFKKEVFDNYVDTMVINDGKVRSSDIGEHEDSPYYPPAWILTNNRTGQRCEVKNPFYEMAKNLRNMNPNMRYQYLHLRKTNQLGDYLLAFPRYKMYFGNLENEYEQFVTEVHSAYVKFYIKKERDQHIPKQYFVHAARVHHNLYLKQDPALPRRKVTRDTIYFYFNGFSATKMFYFLTRTEEGEQEPNEDEEEVSEPAVLRI
jgi:hypothetical protein